MPEHHDTYRHGFQQLERVDIYELISEMIHDQSDTSALAYARIDPSINTDTRISYIYYIDRRIVANV
jgi:hypothetical protein